MTTARTHQKDSDSSSSSSSNESSSKELESNESKENTNNVSNAKGPAESLQITDEQYLRIRNLIEAKTSSDTIRTAVSTLIFDKSNIFHGSCQFQAEVCLTLNLLPSYDAQHFDYIQTKDLRELTRNITNVLNEDHMQFLVRMHDIQPHGLI